MDVNKVISSMNKNKTRNQKLFEKYGVVLGDDGKIQSVPLYTQNGNKVGDVSYDAYVAVRNGKIYDYTPKNDKDKSVLESYKKYYNDITTDLKMQDGTNLGKMSNEGIKALQDGNIESYTPKNEEEKKTVDAYKKYAQNEYEKAVQEQKDKTVREGKLPQYFLANLGIGIAGAAENLWQVGFSAVPWLAAQALTLGGTAKGVIMSEDWYDSWTKGVEEKLKEKSAAERVTEELNKAMPVPEWAVYGGGLIQAAGNMLPSMALEVATAGASPVMEMEAVNFTNRMSNLEKISAYATKGLKQFFKPSQTVFGLSAAGGYMQDAYRKSGNFGGSLVYGLNAGFGEMATEMLFGGFAGTDIGESVIDFSIKNKFARKAVNFLTEGVEEAIMEEAAPLLEKVFINKNAEMPSITQVLESGRDGIALSLIMGAGTYHFQKHQTQKAIDVLNTTIDTINKIMPSANIEMLSKNATQEDIKNKQKVIRYYANEIDDAYDKQLNNYDSMQKELEKHIKEYDEKTVSVQNVSDAKTPAEKAALQKAVDIKNDYINDKQILISDIDKIKAGDKSTIEKYQREDKKSFEDLNPTHIDLATHQYVNISQNADGTYTVIGQDNIPFVKTKEQINLRYEDAQKYEETDKNITKASETQSAEQSNSADTSNAGRSSGAISDEEINDIQGSSEIERYAPSDNAELVKLENDLILQGVSDEERKSAIESAAKEQESGQVSDEEVKNAQTYKEIVSVLKTKAQELGLLDKEFFKNLENVRINQLTDADKVLISNEFERVFAGNTDPIVASWLDAIRQETTESEGAESASEDTSNNDAELANGEILSLKHTKNVYSIFKGAKRIIFGKDLITDSYALLPLTEENLAGVKNVVGDLGESNPNFDLNRFISENNRLLIEGVPKVGEADFGGKKTGAYLFKINGKYYCCQQKYIDAFNNGKNKIYVNPDNVGAPWSVYNENGEFVGAFLGVRPPANADVAYNSLPSVSDILNEQKQRKADNAANPFNQNKESDIKRLADEATTNEANKEVKATEAEETKPAETEKVPETKMPEENSANLTDKCKIVKTKHTQTGKDIWVISLKEKISADEYRDLSKKVKSVGGYYSRFAKTLDGENLSGFVFKAEPTANQFKVFNDFFGTDESNEQSENPYDNKTKQAEDIETRIANESAEFEEANSDRLLEAVNDVLNDTELSKKVLDAFQKSALDGWNNSDIDSATSVKRRKIKRAIYDVLQDKAKTEQCFKALLNKSESNNLINANNETESLKNEPESDIIKEKPDLVVGDIIEHNGKKWKVASTDFFMEFENVDKNDEEQMFGFVGGMDAFKKTHDYTVVESASKQNATADNNAKETKENGTKRIADYVSDKLSKGEKITALELSKISSEAFGGTMADNAYSIKDAYDAMELGVNQYILSMKDVSAEKMLEVLNLLPTQTKRTEEMVKFQQFSTPPSIAYLANYAANVNSNDIMLEPSAGIGGIAVFAKKDGATVYVNELDKRRLAVLKNMPFDGFFNEDAEQIDNILGGEIEPTVIVMNPPFSSSSERNIHNTKIGAKHIEQALKILAPNGRLVAIVGRGMEDGAPAFRDWWKSIKSKYNVRANIRVDGKNYNKYGTNFDIQMLVIDKNGPTTQTETGYVETLQELQEKLGGIRNERPAVDYSANEQRTSATARTETVEAGKRAGIANGTVSDTSSRESNRKRPDTGNVDERNDVQKIQPADGEDRRNDITKPESTDAVADGQRFDGRREPRGNTEQQDSGRSDGNIGNQHSEQSVQRRVRGNSGNGTSNDKRRKHSELTDSIFEQYQPSPLLVENAQPHPGKVSESAAMNAIEPPPVTYKPHISQSIIDNGTVSDVQLEAISYAGQSHSQTLPDGTTRGFFLGDGTGIGKGRTIAGIILDNYNQGKKKALWVTLNQSLVNDAKRDIKALFGNSDLVTWFSGGKKADKSLSSDNAILVASYPTLATGFDKKGSNLEKVISWLGKDFDGVIVFDESHKMAKATANKTSRGKSKPSETGLMGLALQQALPKAKIVYSSATGATEVENLRYAERLGLWGEGTPFTNGNDFVEKIKAGGIAAMELIARDMKAMGVYLSRNISYDDVKYDKITHNLTATQRKIYDELARSWQIVLQNVGNALVTTNQNKDGDKKGRVLGAFWGTQQRFFNQILTSMQVPSVISDIEKQLADGKSCVIQLVSTNESAQNEEFERLEAEGLELDEFDLTPKQMLMSYVEKYFPIQQFEVYEDDNGNKRSKPVYDSKGNPVINREAVKQRDELLAKLGSIKVPSSPLDMIINHFGTDLVAENTGRARRVIQKDGKFIEEKIASKKEADVESFQNGDKRIIIFSKAGGTGKSYHADRAAKNQQQRVHYLLEAGWQADNAVQGFGRSHRSNQAVAPIFKLVTTDLKGQMRFISTIAKRLDQLGAMTKGQRQAGSQGLFSASDNLENSFAADVLANFYKDLVSNRVDGISDGLSIIQKLGLKDKILDEYNRIIPTASELREVNKFLNRILTLESTEQNTVFEGFSNRLQDATERAFLAGTLDKGLENYKADRITLNEVQDIREDEKSGAKTKYYNLTAEHKIKPIKFSDVNTDSKSFVGFYKNKNTGAVRAVMQTSSSTDQYGRVTNNYKLVGQSKNEYIPQNRLYGNWEKIESDEARKLWDKAISELPEYRKESLHLIGGVVLPVWNKLPTENVRIYRVLTTDGDMLIGRVIPDSMIDETLRRLGSKRTKEKVSTKDLITEIKNGATAYLDNGWKIVQRKVSGENRIEIIGPSYETLDLLKGKGVFTETIQYNTRYFVPTDTNTETIMDAILKISPLERMEQSENYSLEESNNEQKRNVLSDGISKRESGISTGKQTGRLDESTEKSAEERNAYTKALKDNQKETVTLRDSEGRKHQYTAIKQSAWTDDMNALADKYAKKGVELIFITGNIKIPFSEKSARGMRVGNKIIVSYDNSVFSPEQIARHEYVHLKYRSKAIQNAKNNILAKMPKQEYNKAINELRQDYEGVSDNVDDLEQELICNVLSGMYDNTAFDSIASEYWSGEAEGSLGYNAAEYAESIDAGGNAEFVDGIGLGGTDMSFRGQNIDYAVDDKWHPDLSKRELAALNDSIKRDIETSVNEITDTANWFSTRINGKSVFAIYSTENVDNPTLLYESKGRQAEFEKEYLLNLMEAIENGESTDGKSNFVGRVSGGGWLQQGNGIRNNRGTVGRGSGNRDAGVLQGQSRGKRSPAFRSVIANLFEIQRENRRSTGMDGRGGINYSIDRDTERAENGEHTIQEMHELFERDKAGVPKPGKKDIWGERASYIAAAMTRTFPLIPESGDRGEFFAEFRKAMVQWKGLPTTASFITQDNLYKMTKALSPEEYETFAKLVYFLDLQEEAKLQADRGDEILLPHGYTADEVNNMVNELNAETTEKVKEAITKRKEIWNELKRRYIEANRYVGFDVEDKFSRENYYHHQVIEYLNEKSNGTGSRKAEIKDKRDWLKARHGSVKAINTDFLAVEYQAMLQMQYDVYIAETLGKIKDKYDIKPQLEKAAFNHNKNALNAIIMDEATDESGNVLYDDKGRPVSETYKEQQWYNSRIMYGFSTLFDLSIENNLPDFGNAYRGVISGLKKRDLQTPGLYNYISEIAALDTDENTSDETEQAVIAARTVLKYTAQKKAWVKGLLGANYQTWETLAKNTEGYTIHQPRRGNYFYTKEVLNADIVDQAIQNVIASLASGDINAGGDLKKLMSDYSETLRLTGAAYEQWVIPDEIVKTMDDIANPKQKIKAAEFSREALNMWKGWATSINPLRTIKFGFRNITGDLDAVIAGKPQIIRYSKQAIQEIYQAMHDKNYSDDFMEWTMRGGYSSMIFANEMDPEMQERLFSYLIKNDNKTKPLEIPAKLLRGYLNGVETAHNFREAILRYSAYLYFKDAIERSGGKVSDYVASNKAIVNGLDSIEDKAYQLSKDLLGAYDELSYVGQVLRRHIIPFYSFTETNFKRYYRMYKNVLTSDASIPKKILNTALLTLRANLLTILMYAWNKLFKKDDDDKLPPSVRNIPHITIGRIGNNVIAFRQLGSLSELFEWFGLDDFRIDKDDLNAPIDKAWGMITPFAKAPFELFSGLNFYPSVRNPSLIRDKGGYIANSLGVKDLYDYITGKPNRGIGKIISGALVYSYDIDESNYYEILDIKRNYQGKSDELAIYPEKPHQQALRNMKKAIRYKDEKAALKYMNEYFEKGGTGGGLKQSFISLDPMYGYLGKDTKEKGDAFIASLTPEEKEKLIIAQAYYENELALPKEVASKIGSKTLSDEEAKNLLRNYIKAKCN